MKKRYRESENAWEGFDGGEYVYSESAEKKYESSVWKYLAMASLLLFLFVVFMQVKELRITSQGTCIEAIYDKSSSGAEIAKYVDDAGKIYLYDISGMNSVHTEDTVMLYYRDNISEAIPKTDWKLWCMYYLFFVVLGGISFWRIYKIYKK